jgi:hypothetical protein
MFSLFLIAQIACSSKPTPPVTPVEIPSETSIDETSDCPEGVKVGCNVPDVTQADIDANNAKTTECIDTCIASRQTEAVSAEMIESQCQQQCMEEHFMGQVEVVPTLEESPE